MSKYLDYYRHHRQEMRELELHSKPVQDQLDALEAKIAQRKEAQSNMSYRRYRKPAKSNLVRTLLGLKG